MQLRLSRYFVWVMTLFALAGCGADQSNQKSGKGVLQAKVDDFSSPKNLFVDYIASHTGGVISKASAIRLQLVKAAGDSLAGTAIEKQVFNFSPAIKGSTYWEDNRTLVFQPEKPLPNDQTYKVTAKLDALIPDIDGDKEEFRFRFQTLKQNYDIKISGIQLYSKDDLNRVKLEGRLQTADQVNLEEVRQMMAASQENKSLAIQWKYAGKDNTYQFVIEEVSRGDEEGIVKLEVNGEAIGVDRKVTLEEKIPALAAYKVISSKVVEGDDLHVSVLFSDPIDEKQNLEGLVRLVGVRAEPRLVISLNELKIYPTQEIKYNTELKISKHIRNTAGLKLKKDYTTKLQFTQVKPEVRLVNNTNKAILPNSNGLLLPFEAVGLEAVDVTVIKIFEDNMLQYLQNNSLGSQRELRRVARPVARQTVPLNTSGVTNLSEWNRYSLNLEDIMKTEPGAVYQVQIGFSKKHSLYVCEQDENIDEIELDEWGAEDENSYWDAYQSYYSPGYEWSERDNPCHSSYYGKRRAVSKILFASDLGILAKKSDRGDMHVFITNLISTESMSGVSVEVYDYQQQLVGQGETSAEGKAVISVKGKPFVLIARQGDQIGYLKLDDGSALSLSNFNVAGSSVQNGLKGFLYSERGVHRPGDTLHIGFILEDITGKLPEQHPVILELYDPMGKLSARKVSAKAIGSMYRFDVATEKEAPTGNWQAKAKVGGAVFTKTMKVETIKPNRLKIELDFAKERFDITERQITADLKVRWLSGAKAGNLKAEFDMVMSPVKTTFENYPNFQFDDQSKSFYQNRETVYEGRIDAEGYARVNFDLGKAKNAPGALKATFLGKVYEEGGDFSIKNVSIPYYPYESFVGLMAPEGDKRGMLLTDKDHKIRIATVDSKGKPVSRQKVKVELYKLNWRWWWDNSSDNISNYIGRSYRSAIQKAEINTVNGEGQWNLRINHPSWGRYYVRVTDPVSGHSAGKVIYLDWPGWAGKGKRGGMGGASMLDFGIEKDEYKVGEKVALTIPTTRGNRILVSLESGSEVLKTYWVEANEENTTFEFEATPDMAPNVYVHLTMIQPHGQTYNDLPIRLYGVQSVKVVNPATVLKPQIKMPENLAPEQRFTLEVSESNGKPMAYTVAVVDEGLLDITNYNTPNPWGSFYAREALGIKTWDVYDDVMGAFVGSLDHLLAIGGDAELAGKEEKETNRFKPVVQFHGPFYLEAGETTTHQLKLPQYIGSIKTMVVAAGDGAYGSADQVTPVNQPMMIMATLPRVAGPGEFMKLPVNVFALNDEVEEVVVTVETEGLLTAKGSKSKTVRFNKAGDQVIYFDLQADEQVGQAKVKVRAKSGKLEATYDVSMEVMPRNPETTDVQDKIVAAGEEWTFDYQPYGIRGKNKGVVELSTLPSLNIEQRLGYLISYPHGCVEQTTSSVFAQLFLDQLIELDEPKKLQVQHHVEAAIKRLKSFQVASGGFAYWPGNDYPNLWGSNYAGHFLVEAKNQGYSVPEGMLTSWISFQTEQAEAWSDMSTDNNTDEVQAYRLYTLAKAGEPAMGAMNRMKEKTDLSAQSKWRLALAYALAGYEQQATGLIEGAAATPPKRSGYYATFGSHTRDEAMMLETLLALDKNEEAFALLQKIAGKMGDTKKWMSTQTTAYCFISIAKYTQQFPIEGNMMAEIVAHDQKHEMTGDKFISQLTIENADKPEALHVRNKGEAPVFARLIRRGVALEGTEQAAENGLEMKVVYKTLSGDKVNVSKLKQGTNFMAEVTLTNPGMKGKYNELALSQIFPSGWEIINTRLDGTNESMASDKAEYMDIRDDRVMHYFDLKPSQSLTFKVLLNAAYQGKYYLPSVSAEAMYDHTIYARKAGQWVEVYAENESL